MLFSDGRRHHGQRLRKIDIYSNHSIQFHKKQETSNNAVQYHSGYHLKYCNLKGYINFQQENNAIKLLQVFVNLPCLNSNIQHIPAQDIFYLNIHRNSQQTKCQLTLRF